MRCPGVVTATYLSIESDGAGLTLGADPLRPGRMTLAARLYLTADILQSCKLPSAGDQNPVRTQQKAPPTEQTQIKPLTYQRRRSACEGTRGMTCASLVGRDDSGSLRQKAEKKIIKKLKFACFKILVNKF